MGKDILVILSVLTTALFWAFQKDFRANIYLGGRGICRPVKVIEHFPYVNNVMNTRFHDVRIY